MKKNKKSKVIIDTDVGVDDALAVILALHDEDLDIKLFAVPPGNVSTKIGTRNICHLLDLFNKNIPVVAGPKTALARVSEDAAWLHGKEGLGGYIPPKKTICQPLNEDCADVMYRIIKENPHEVTILEFGPHTNIGRLIQKYPDVTPLIKEVVFEGAAPFGLPGNPNYISFNARTDPEALKIVLDSGVPALMVPSNIGRFSAHLTADQVDAVCNMNDVGRFLSTTCQTYWEPDVPDKRIATNDTCAYLYLDAPKLYKYKKAFVAINITDAPGKSLALLNKKGNVKIVTKVNRKKIHKLIFEKLHALDQIKFDDSIYALTRAEQEKKANAEKKKVETKKKSTTKKTASKTTSKKEERKPTSTKKRAVSTNKKKS